jgi:hypothetical protein
MLSNSWNKFNDRTVTFASVEEVFELNFGGIENMINIDYKGNLEVIQNEVDRSAYILIYIQKDRIHDIFKEIKDEVVLFNIGT